MTNARSTNDIEVTHNGHRAIVRKNNEHPESYLFIYPEPGRQFFLGVHVPGMTRGQVKAMARRWLEEHRG